MPERTATCGEDGSKTTLPDSDWDTVQQPALQTWERQHGQEAHDGEDFMYQLDPDPFRDGLRSRLRR